MKFFCRKTINFLVRIVGLVCQINRIGRWTRIKVSAAAAQALLKRPFSQSAEKYAVTKPTVKHASSIAETHRAGGNRLEPFNGPLCWFFFVPFMCVKIDQYQILNTPILYDSLCFWQTIKY